MIETSDQIVEMSAVDPVVAEVQGMIIMGMGAILGFLLVEKIADSILVKYGKK